MEQQFVEVVRSEIHKHLMRQRIPVRSVTRDRCVAIAAKSLGMLVERNGASIEKIVEAAEAAHDTHPESCRRCRCRHFSDGLGGKAIGCDCECHAVFDTPAFFRAIAGAALGEEFDESELRFTIPNVAYAGGRPFSVPRLEGAKS